GPGGRRPARGGRGRRAPVRRPGRGAEGQTRPAGGRHSPRPSAGARRWPGSRRLHRAAPRRGGPPRLPTAPPPPTPALAPPAPPGRRPAGAGDGPAGGGLATRAARRARSGRGAAGAIRAAPRRARLRGGRADAHRPRRDLVRRAGRVRDRPAAPRVPVPYGLPAGAAPHRPRGPEGPRARRLLLPEWLGPRPRAPAPGPPLRVRPLRRPADLAV